MAVHLSVVRHATTGTPRAIRSRLPGMYGQASPQPIVENAAATAAGLYTIILMFGPVSGGLWCELTSGHELAAPLKLPGTLYRHREFKEHHLDGLRERLVVLGQLLLDTPTRARSTLPTQLAATLTTSKQTRRRKPIQSSYFFI
jgi:hypothetical protein